MALAGHVEGMEVIKMNTDVFNNIWKKETILRLRFMWNFNIRNGCHSSRMVWTAVIEWSVRILYLWLVISRPAELLLVSQERSSFL
jgi:hypothetical protein